MHERVTLMVAYRRTKSLTNLIVRAKLPLVNPRTSRHLEGMKNATNRHVPVVHLLLKEQNSRAPTVQTQPISPQDQTVNQATL